MGSSLERFYKGGLWIKGLNGTLELIGAALLILAPPCWWHRITEVLRQQDLGRGGTDRLYGMLARGFAHLEGDSHGFAIFYLASHGVVKIVLAVLLFRQVRAAFPAGVAIFGLLIAYELYRLVRQPGILISGIVLLDLSILTLIVIHWRRHPT